VEEYHRGGSLPNDPAARRGRLGLAPGDAVRLDRRRRPAAV